MQACADKADYILFLEEDVTISDGYGVLLKEFISSRKWKITSVASCLHMRDKN